MAKLKSKDELLEQIKVERRRLERYLPKFNPEQMCQPGVAGEWSVKDTLAHIFDWEQRFLAWYRAELRGESPEVPAPGMTWEHIDLLNQQIFEQHRERPLEEVLDEFHTSYSEILQVVEAIPEEALFAQGRYAWTGEFTLADFVAGNTSDHYREHKESIRKWWKANVRERLTKADILERIEVERRRLEANLDTLSEEQMVQPGVVGEWSVKDVVAHLFDWEQRFVGWYEAGLRGEVPETPAPGLTWGQLDILNRQIFEQHRDRSLDDVMAEFRSSYERTLKTVESIPAEDMSITGRYAWLGKGNLAGYILANTASHYRWAKTLIRKWMKAQGLL